MKQWWWFLLLLIAGQGNAVSQNKIIAVELNAENVFDTQHDSLKNDYEFLPDSKRHWTNWRYWNKLNNIGKEIIACGRDSDGWNLPDLVALCEVENDTVLRDLTKRSLLRTMDYEYIMTDSPDERGIDVALLYSPFTFGLISHHSIRIDASKGLHPTRDILYAKGLLINGDTLHVFVIHAPSRISGDKRTRQLREQVTGTLCQSIDSVSDHSSNAQILVMGDFNDYASSPIMQKLSQSNMANVSARAKGSHGAKGSYRYKGQWKSIDHIFVSNNLSRSVTCCKIADYPFLMEDDTKYGGKKPFRTFYGMRYIGGFSDHLPVVVQLVLR